MPDEKHTRCPGCATVFRVTAEQLALRAGQVRCGHCKTVFDGVAQRVSFALPGHYDGDAPAIDEAALGPPTVALRNAQALEPPPRIPPEALGMPTGESVAEIHFEDRFSSAKARGPQRAQIIASAIAIVFLVSLILAQAVLHFRDTIVARWPAARPVLVRLCEVAGCAIRPLRDAAMSYLSIEASDLQADPAHRGLLILTATLRNRAQWSVSYPHLELTLTDAQDRIVVRRALAPVDYAGGTVDVHSGIGPNAEIALKVFIDASATAQAGYRLYMFYP
jgi:predicted Zn finger-like uncharacterized protein